MTGLIFCISSAESSFLNCVELGLRDATEDVNPSKMIIEEQLGRPTRFFAYPYGAGNKELKAFVAPEFDAACPTKVGQVNRRSDVYLLERLDVGYVFKQWKSRWTK